jgi:hypothetical protein
VPGGRRGTVSINANQSVTSGGKQKAGKKHPTTESSSNGTGLVAAAGSTEAIGSGEEPRLHNAAGSDPALANAPDGGSKQMHGSGGGMDRNRGHHWRGPENYGPNTGPRRNVRDQVRSSNHGWHQRPFRPNNNGPGTQVRVGPRNFNNNRNMYNNNNVPEFGNPAGVHFSYLFIIKDTEDINMLLLFLLIGSLTCAYSFYPVNLGYLFSMP